MEDFSAGTPGTLFRVGLEESQRAGVAACDVMGDAGAVRVKESWVELARRMERLRTETAFSVLAKAKAGATG